MLFLSMEETDRKSELRDAARALWLAEGSGDAQKDLRTILGRPNLSEGRVTRTAELLDVTPQELQAAFEAIVPSSRK